MIAPGKCRFRPRLWPTLITLAMLAVLAGLGTWQFQRLEWKETLIAQLAARAVGFAENPGGLPLGAETRIHLKNHHLAYAITWYTLAFPLLVIYVLHQPRSEDRSGADD